MLPRIFERAGNFARGSITGFFTVLVEGDDMNEPIADAVRGILDGHIVLSRELGQAGHYPAVDVLQSVSRLASRLAKDGHNDRANRVRETLALLRSSEDLIRLGAYAAGTNARLDEALGMKEQLNAFLRQHPEERSRMDATREALERLAGMGIVK
jgi:flagellar biosynthesis/type III secretory pathway ATPase